MIDINFFPGAEKYCRNSLFFVIFNTNGYLTGLFGV
jgi:hypothetical protein